MNKKNTLAIFTCLFTAASFAQISKGTTFIGGNAGLNVGTYKSGAFKDTYTSFSVFPSFGFTYKENRVAGFLLNYQHNNNGNQLPPSNIYGAGVFLRQYKPLGKGFYVFAQEALNFNYTKLKGDSVAYNYTKALNIFANVNPGLAYDLTKRMQVELLFNDLITVGYNHYDYLIPSNYKQSNFYINSSFNLSQLSSVNLGIRFLLGRG